MFELKKNHVYMANVKYLVENEEDRNEMPDEWATAVYVGCVDKHIRLVITEGEHIGKFIRLYDEDGEVYYGDAWRYHPSQWWTLFQ